MFNRVLFVFFLVIVASCKDNDTDPIPTSLEITFLDGAGEAIPDVSAKIYKSENDLLNNSNQVGSQQISNEQGVVRFSNLESIKYYWSAEKGCLNNKNSSITTQEALTANRVNLVNSILSETASISLINNSFNSFEFFLNGRSIDVIAGQTSYTLNGLSSGFYSIRVVQVSGIVSNPIDLSYSSNISCNNDTTISFP